ncbi:MAG: NIPSNAP family protein [Bradyrhizobiaceae bacterium]|nr:MAG: NIPSNAP family protein [Bradyrhizobiaceae bacterium]
MIIEHRTYVVRPGTLSAQLKLYEACGFAAQKRHLGSPLAFLITEFGDVNSYIHMWLYDDAADREARRSSLALDNDWRSYLQKSAAAAYIIRQESRLLKPASFAPLARREEQFGPND